MAPEQKHIVLTYYVEAKEYGMKSTSRHEGMTL
jgi:hypothetical protein